MDIKTIFTEEATKLLDRESKSLAQELRDAAVNEALRSRGEPVEVTASDVRRAREMFQRREIKLRPTTDLVLRLYMIIGAGMCVVGLAYPALQDLMTRTGMESRLSLIMALAGLVTSILAFVMRQHLEAMVKGRTRRALEQEDKTSSQQPPA